MKTFDWIVVGGGVAGSALGYELAQVGCSVLLIDQAIASTNATRYSYGGIAYWSGNNPLTQQLCQEAIGLYAQLSDELDGDTQFREVDLLLTIDPGRDAHAIAALYCRCWKPPQLISADDACALEPLLDRSAVGGALHNRHGHVSPVGMTHAYQQAMQRHGGQVCFERVTQLLQQGDRVEGVQTTAAAYRGANVVVAAGALSRALLRSAGLPIRLYFTQAELIETPPVDLRLNTLVMPAELKRFEMEAVAGQTDALWDEAGQEVTPPVLDAGAVQFQDGSLRIGQISRTCTDLAPAIDTARSEADLRGEIGRLLPALRDLPGQWCQCPVAFSGDRLPLIGALPNAEGIHVFSGFSNPFALMPPLARRFARHATGQPDDLLAQMSLDRFAQAAV